MSLQPLRHVTVMRYVLPLREGGSLPALADGDDGFKYVVKFRGAGHGVKMLISELLGGLIAKELGLRVPELVFIHLDEDFGRTEADEEIQDLLKFSKGLNLGLHYLSSALTYEPKMVVEAGEASRIVWLDCYITNIDRTFKNTNMLWWKQQLWLIDHGASFYFHHSWQNIPKAARSVFPYVKDHVLLPYATELHKADAFAHSVLSREVLATIVEQIPSDWLLWEDVESSPEQLRAIYLEFLVERLENSHLFLKQASDARV